MKKVKYSNNNGENISDAVILAKAVDSATVLLYLIPKKGEVGCLEFCEWLQDYGYYVPSSYNDSYLNLDTKTNRRFKEFAEQYGI